MDKRSTLALLLACVLPLGCGAADDPLTLKGYNVVLIVVDSLRADHLSAYGYERQTSPFLDKLAREGVVFEQALSNSSYTRESVASLFTGLLPSRGGATGWYARPRAESTTLAEYFKREGYRTACISNSVMLKHELFRQGFDEMHFTSKSSMESGSAPKLTRRALEFVDEKGTDPEAPFFLYAHFLDPHGPYHPPAPNYRRFADRPYPEPVQLYGPVRNRCYYLRKEGFGPGDPRFEDLVLRYDAEITYVDDSIRALIEGLEERGELDHTMIIVTADHGEEFLEHDFVEHAWTVYLESIHVPLLLWAPKKLLPTRVSDRVALVNLAPTLLALTEVDYEHQDLDGLPLFRRADNHDDWQPTVPGGPIIAEMLVGERQIVRTVISSNWKYNAAQRWLGFPEREELAPNAARLRRKIESGEAEGVDPWGPAVHEELFNLDSDPGELDNLLERNPTVLARMRELLQDYANRCANISNTEGRFELSDEDAAQIDALGY